MLGVLATVALVVILVVEREGDPPWMTIELLGVGLGAYVRRQKPELPASAWFAAGMGLGPVTSLTETLQVPAFRAGEDLALSWAFLANNVVAALGMVFLTYLIAFFPDGRPGTRRQLLLVRAAWITVLAPLLSSLGSPVVHPEPYLAIADRPNRLHVLPFSLSESTASWLGGLGFLAAIVGLAIMLTRYRHADRFTRRGMRWLLLPVLLIPIGVLTQVLLSGVGVVVWIAWMLIMLLMNLALGLGIVRPERLDVDVVLSRTLAYSVLWLAIAGTYVALATMVGVTAENYLSVGWSVALALAVGLLFQPVRARMEALANRWVFGRRSDPAQVIAELGNTLSQTLDLESLLPRMAGALQEGLGVTWARVRLEDRSGPEPGEEPGAEHGRAEVSVPVVLDDEHLGVVECGPKAAGAWNDDDRAVVATFARQAALAVRNVRLTERLATNAEQLAASRTRLVEAQESERRRIERNIHDGVQQHLVALIGLAGQIRQSPTINGNGRDLGELQDGLSRVLDDLRDLARGIYPSLLSDKGLLVAVEAIAARHTIPTVLRADPSLRGLRFGRAAEAACYFTVAEALANSLKHANAQRVDLTLAREEDDLVITISDDGDGFDPDDATRRAGQGLGSLQDRFAALGGDLAIRSSPGGGTTLHARMSLRESAMT